MQNRRILRERQKNADVEIALLRITYKSIFWWRGLIIEDFVVLYIESVFGFSLTSVIVISHL